MNLEVKIMNSGQKNDSQEVVKTGQHEVEIINIITKIANTTFNAGHLAGWERVQDLPFGPELLNKFYSLILQEIRTYQTLAHSTLPLRTNVLKTKDNLSQEKTNELIKNNQDTILLIRKGINKFTSIRPELTQIKSLFLEFVASQNSTNDDEPSPEVQKNLANIVSQYNQIFSELEKLNQFFETAKADFEAYLQSKSDPEPQPEEPTQQAEPTPA